MKEGSRYSRRYNFFILFYNTRWVNLPFILKDKPKLKGFFRNGNLSHPKNIKPSPLKIVKPEIIPRLKDLITFNTFWMFTLNFGTKPYKLPRITLRLFDLHKFHIRFKILRNSPSSSFVSSLNNLDRTQVVLVKHTPRVKNHRVWDTEKFI